MKISVLTPSIPERADLLRRCRLSVKAQTLAWHEYEHLVMLDEAHRGCSWAVNQLALEALGEYILILADDDVILPYCLESLLEHAASDAIVYSPPFVSGNGDGHFFGEPPKIPSFGLISRTLWDACGGYDEGAKREEDRILWTAALEQGVRFVRVDTPLWVYGFHKDARGRYRNKSYRGGVAT